MGKKPLVGFLFNLFFGSCVVCCPMGLFFFFFCFSPSFDSLVNLRTGVFKSGGCSRRERIIIIIKKKERKMESKPLWETTSKGKRKWVKTAKKCDGEGVPE